MSQSKQELLRLCDQAIAANLTHREFTLANELCSLLTAPQEGYVRVPVEPTDEMCRDAAWAYEEAMGGDRLPDGNGYDYEVVTAVYKAMLAASPPIPQAGGVQDALRKITERRCTNPSEREIRDGKPDAACDCCSAHWWAIQDAQPSPQPVEAGTADVFQAFDLYLDVTNQREKITALPFELFKAGATHLEHELLKAQYSIGLADRNNEILRNTIRIQKERIAVLQSPPSPEVGKLVEALQTTSHALENLFALVNGESPSLLEDDHHFTMVENAIAVARAALQSKPTTEGRGWISTEERLPGEGETCFFIPTSGAVFGGFYKDGYFFRHGGRYTRNVVYWWQQVAYPLPPPPTQPETKEVQG